MEFCSNCSSLLEIVQDNNLPVQSGGVNYETIIESILLNIDNIDSIKKTLNNIEIKDILKSSEYKSLSLNNQELLYNIIEEILPSNKKKISSIISNKSENIYDIFYKCNDCSYSKLIEPNTLIYSESVKKEESHLTDLSYLIDDPLYPRTKNYTCINKECESHTSTNKMALFKRMNNKKLLICEICKHQWLQ